MQLKNFQYNKIIREYDKRQLDNRHQLEERIKEIYNLFPEMKEIDDQIVSNSIQSAKLSLMGDDQALTTLADRNMDLSMRKIEILTENGYSSTYLTPSFQCKDCKDTGYIGKEKCHCFKQAIVDLLYSQSNIKGIMQQENFSSFRYDFYPDSYVEETTGLTPLANIRKVVASCMEYIDSFDTTYANLLLYGNAGVGKTFLANCIAKELLDRSHTVIYLTAFQLFDILEKNKFNKDQEKEEANEQFAYILDCDLLIIDDLGTELNNSFVTSQLYLCINERHLRKNSTIISTNLSWDNLNTNYSERIFSRIASNYKLLKIVGDDIRIKKAFSN
ncbi:ATP-binding protein [Anaerosporobacter faecicola]|uniref:ATP-binding protein n=1 Tax=Anaerosporobacter faecicola TaxID=2718714 RepID=UPI001439AF3E|nr:ATP-binding protein [Anaerosporobacter faecicola]